jgi:LysR family transcriptional regulator, chromosome initiation inhibitor
MTLLSPDVEAFLRIAEHGTVRAAALRLGLTQTAVTRRLANLEERLQCSLFLRGSRGMTLTEEGNLLLRQATDMVLLERNALAGLGVATDSQSTHIRIRGPSSLVRSRLLPEVAKAILVATEKITVEWQVEDVDCDLEALKRLACDLIVVPAEQLTPSPSLSRRLLRPEEYVMVVPRAWRQRSAREIAATERIVDFNPADALTHRYLTHFNLAKTLQLERHFANNTDALATMVSLGLGYSVLSREFSAVFVERGELAIIDPSHALKERHALAWHPRRFWPNAWKHVLAALR